MENTQNNMPEYSSGNDKKTVLITVEGMIKAFVERYAYLLKALG